MLLCFEEFADFLEVFLEYLAEGWFVEHGCGVVEGDDGVVRALYGDVAGFAVECADAGDVFHALNVESGEDEFGCEVP